MTTPYLLFVVDGVEDVDGVDEVVETSLEDAPA
jgi:hypothetical protein